MKPCLYSTSMKHCNIILSLGSTTTRTNSSTRWTGQTRVTNRELMKADWWDAPLINVQDLAKAICITTSNIHWSPQARYLIACPNFKLQSQKIFRLRPQISHTPKPISKEHPFLTACGREDLRRTFPSLRTRKKIFTLNLFHIKYLFPGSTSNTKRWSLSLTLHPASLNWTRYTEDEISVGPK